MSERKYAGHVPPRAIPPRDACKPDERTDRDAALAQITISLHPGGVWLMRSTCLDRPDASYMPLPDSSVAKEVTKLVNELRQRLAGIDPSANRR